MRRCQAAEIRPLEVKLEEEELWKTQDKRIWMPSNLWERLIIHNLIAGHHQAVENELKTLKQYYIELSQGRTIKEMLKSLMNNCVHCQRRPAILKGHTI